MSGIIGLGKITLQSIFIPFIRDCQQLWAAKNCLDRKTCLIMIFGFNLKVYLLVLLKISFVSDVAIELICWV